MKQYLLRIAIVFMAIALLTVSGAIQEKQTGLAIISKEQGRCKEKCLQECTKEKKLSGLGHNLNNLTLAVFNLNIQQAHVRERRNYHY